MNKYPFDYQAPDYQAPSVEQKKTLNKVRDCYQTLFELILERVPDSRERSLAITNLEQSNMWLNKAIVFTEELEVVPAESDRIETFLNRLSYAKEQPASSRGRFA